jgi:hypothetical protein
MVRDPRRPSGGNTYDRELCAGLAASGWQVVEHLAPGTWPDAGDADRARLAGVLARLPDDAVVLVDGLIGSAVPELLAAVESRLRLVVLVHQPLGSLRGPDADAARARERDALACATAVVAPSRWTREWLLAAYEIGPDHLYVAEPGAAPAPAAPGTAAGGELLCVAAVTAAKGLDTFVEALATIRDLTWSAVVVGALDVEPAFAEGLRARVRAHGLDDRVQLTGPLDRGRLDAAYAAADLVVLPSRAETYGLVVTEALARALPVVASDVGGVPEALGHAPDGGQPGVLLPPGEAAALGDALRSWLLDPRARALLRARAAARRTTLPTWARTAQVVSDALAEPSRARLRMQQRRE